MGVMSCSRNGCENIMCDRLSKKFGYICNDCFIELQESLLPPTAFMKTQKKDGSYEKDFKKFHNEMMEREFPVVT